MSTTGNDKGPDRLRNFGKRLDETLTARQKPKSSGSEEGSALSLAFRAITDLIVGVAVTAGLGWVLDRYLGTSPWLMLILMPFGFAAGVWNVMRLSGSKEAQNLLDGRAPGETKFPPSVKDDEDDA
ncbi:MAG: AtpZ/AtpI family protein [Hyphomicrobiales bacterium]